jgi:hypothetical protein
MNYFCGGPYARGGYLLGTPDCNGPRWTILYGRNAKSSKVARAKIASAWW